MGVLGTRRMNSKGQSRVRKMSEVKYLYRRRSFLESEWLVKLGATASLWAPCPLFSLWRQESRRERSGPRTMVVLFGVQLQLPY